MATNPGQETGTRLGRIRMPVKEEGAEAIVQAEENVIVNAASGA